MAHWLASAEPRAVGDLVQVGKFFARNLGGLIRARTCAGPAREGNSRTLSMHADEKSDEATVLSKRSNKKTPVRSVGLFVGLACNDECGQSEPQWRTMARSG
jgi:hypothetical protein